MTFCQGTKHNSWLFPSCYGNRLSTIVGYSLVAMVTDYVVISLMISGEHGIQCMPCSSQIISDMLPEIHTMEKCDLLKPTTYSQII